MLGGCLAQYELVPMSSSIDTTYADLAAHKSGDALPFYELEGQVLELWDQLNELKLEKALLEAQGTPPIGKPVAKVRQILADLTYQCSNL